jgi:large subunit ribosomal protein L22
MGNYAVLKTVRITPRKVGLVADQVRGKSVMEAFLYLEASPRKRTAKVIYDVVRSAAYNALREFEMNSEQMNHLWIEEILIGPSKTLKRFKPRAKGSASKLLKRTSHVRVHVSPHPDFLFSRMYQELQAMKAQGVNNADDHHHHHDHDGPCDHPEHHHAAVKNVKSEDVSQNTMREEDGSKG